MVDSGLAKRIMASEPYVYRNTYRASEPSIYWVQVDSGLPKGFSVPKGFSLPKGFSVPWTPVGGRGLVIFSRSNSPENPPPLKFRSPPVI